MERSPKTACQRSAFNRCCSSDCNRGTFNMVVVHRSLSSLYCQFIVRRLDDSEYSRNFIGKNNLKAFSRQHTAELVSFPFAIARITSMVHVLIIIAPISLCIDNDDGGGGIYLKLLLILIFVALLKHYRKRFSNNKKGKYFFFASDFIVFIFLYLFR